MRALGFLLHLVTRSAACRPQLTPPASSGLAAERTGRPAGCCRFTRVFPVVLPEREVLEGVEVVRRHFRGFHPNEAS